MWLIKKLTWLSVYLTPFVLLLAITASIHPAFGQTSTPMATPIDPALLVAFPNELFCSEVGGIQPGPTWQGITVGTSTLDELERYLHTLSSYYTGFVDLDNEHRQWGFGLDQDVVNLYDHIAPGVTGCAQNSVITIMTVYPPLSPYIGRLYLSDLLALHGAPDTVTYTYSSPFIAIAFWFEQGIAAEVGTASNEAGEPDPTNRLLYGLIGRITYFPYQEVEGYETRWPYNRTRAQNPYIPEPIGTENPFDLEAMMATVTLQPSRTPTPTFTIEPPTSTTTATP